MLDTTAFDALDTAAPLVNRVADSDIEVLDLGTLLADALGTDAVLTVDLAPWLHRGLVLREVDFRGYVAAHDWSAATGRVVAVTCSTDALIPTWAWMLVAARLADANAAFVGVGDAETVRSEAVAVALNDADLTRLRDRIVVVKGCGSTVAPDAYARAMTRLVAAGARKVMYGEPCSSVPLWRRPKAPAPGISASGTPVAVRPAALPRPA